MENKNFEKQIATLLVISLVVALIVGGVQIYMNYTKQQSDTKVSEYLDPAPQNLNWSVVEELKNRKETTLFVNEDL